MFSGVRQPAVAGAFYPSTGDGIRQGLSSYFEPVETPVIAKGVLSPHAGWVYSGRVTGSVFSAVEVPDTVILIGPNHRAFGKPIALDGSKKWHFPSGDVEVDIETATWLKSHCPVMEIDTNAHFSEHSLEVVVPFLVARNPSVRIVPVVIYTESWGIVSAIGDALAKAASMSGALLVASSDMTHFLPETTAREIDMDTVHTAEALDARELLNRTRTMGAMCGGAPASAVISACVSLGATMSKLVQYSTSGETSGDHSAVVGYAGMFFR